MSTKALKELILNLVNGKVKASSKNVPLTHEIAALLLVCGDWNAERARSTSVLTLFTSSMSIAFIAFPAQRTTGVKGFCQFRHKQKFLDDLIVRLATCIITRVAK